MVDRSRKQSKCRFGGENDGTVAVGMHGNDGKKLTAITW